MKPITQRQFNRASTVLYMLRRGQDPKRVFDTYGMTYEEAYNIKRRWINSQR